MLQSAARMAAPLLVSPRAVHGSNAVFVNATWFMPGSPRNPRQEHETKRLPAARFFDLDTVASEHPLGLKHMLPSGARFAQTCGLSPFDIQRQFD